MTRATSPIPAGQRTLTPHLVIKDADVAIEFYKKAFGARENYRYSVPDGRVMHADLIIGDSHLFLGDEFPEYGGCFSPQTLGRTSATMHLFVADVDKAFERAVEAGAKAEMPPQDMFWGNRFGRLLDPFGQPWTLATHLEDLTPEDIESRGTEFFKVGMHYAGGHYVWLRKLVRVFLSNFV